MNTLARWVKSELYHFAWQRGWYEPPDRVMLRDILLPALANAPEVQRVLFVGVKWYNEGLDKAFTSRDKMFATIDPDPEQARFGGRPHAIGFVQDIETHFPSTTFDAIVINGVIGAGLNTKEEVSRTLHAFARVLSPRGKVIFGMCPRFEHHQEPGECDGAELFEPTRVGTLTSSRVDLPLPFKQELHTFLCWQKR